MKEKSLQKLQQLQKQLQTNKSTELERRYAIRYHKVRGCALTAAAVVAVQQAAAAQAFTQAFSHAQIRFFERVKLERQIKQLQREGPASDGTEHQQKLQRLRADLQVQPRSAHWQSTAVPPARLPDCCWSQLKHRDDGCCWSKLKH